MEQKSDITGLEVKIQIKEQGPKLVNEQEPGQQEKLDDDEEEDATPDSVYKPAVCSSSCSATPLSV